MRKLEFWNVFVKKIRQIEGRSELLECKPTLKIVIILNSFFHFCEEDFSGYG